MPYIPHTGDDVRAMLAALGVPSIEALFDEIPAALRSEGLAGVPSGMSEMAVMRLMQSRAAADGKYDVYIGAGAYEHHIPAAVWQIATRGEFYTSYTPYQAEASQGTLQVLYEYQSMMTALTGMDATNASLYDGASALAEAALMAVRLHKDRQAKRIVMPRTVHPVWRDVVRTVTGNQGVALTDVPYDAASGCTDLRALDAVDTDGHAALVVPLPNFFGVLEDVDALTDWAHARGLIVIALVNPVALALLKPPGAWGAQGADIAVGDGQPLGIPLSSGGPYFGFMACREAHLRQMPGRIVGRTTDLDGKAGYTLTLQAREQHIRRSRATSNICTNQGLMVTAATVYMALLGSAGLADVARASHANTLRLVERLTALPGVRRAFSAPVFHECVIDVDRAPGPVLRALEAEGILGGLDLGTRYPELDRHLLVCVTETKSAEDLARYASVAQRILAS